MPVFRLALGFVRQINCLRFQTKRKQLIAYLFGEILCFLFHELYLAHLSITVGYRI